MNKFKKLLLVPSISILMISAPFGCMAEDKDLREQFGDLWQVTETGGDMAHVKIDDVFRLKILPNEKRAILTPIGPMKDRLSIRNGLPAQLERQNGPFYCGEVTIRTVPDTNEELMETHNIVLSIVDFDWVILELFEGDTCRYHESHGGWAHAHR